MKILLALSGTVLAFSIAFVSVWLSTKGVAGTIAAFAIAFVVCFIGLYCLISN